MATLSTLFDTSPENPLIIDRRLTTSWNSLAKINAYEKVCFSGFSASHCAYGSVRKITAHPISELLEPMLIPSFVCTTISSKVVLWARDI